VSVSKQLRSTLFGVECTANSLAISSMLEQEELALLMVLSNIKTSPALLQELRKVRATQRRKKALAVAGSASSHSKPGKRTSSRAPPKANGG
jgi:hypothetical protein